jgi:4-amino-4-deoxy-L-arabinose transferase-like glycosyltransferase
MKPDRLHLVATTTAATRRHRRVELLFVLAVGLLTRAAVALMVIRQHPPTWLFTRGTEMSLLATSVLHGEGLSSPFGGHTGPSALVGPLYPLMVAAIFKLFGSYSLASEVTVLSIQVLVSVLNIWFLTRIADRFAGGRAASIAGLLWACSPPLFFMPTILWDTTFTACILTAMVWLALRLRDQPSRRRLLLTSAFFGFAALMNTALFLTALGMVLWIVFQLPAKRLRHLAFSLAVFAVVFLPWPIRNAITLHAFVPLRTTIGLELWMGNHPNSTGHLDEAIFPMFNHAELADYARLGEVGYDHQKRTQALAYIEANPATFTLLSIRRIARFWTGTGSEHSSGLFALHAGLTTLLGAVGLFYLWQRQRSFALLLLTPMLLFPLPYYITHAEFRYRLVLDPLLTMLTGCAVAFALKQRARAGNSANLNSVPVEPTLLPVRRFIANQSGQASILAALSLVSLIAFLGLAIDVGHLRAERRHLQTAADAAALAAGLEFQTCGTTKNCSAMQTAAQKAVVENGYATTSVVTNCASTAVGSGVQVMVNDPVCAVSGDPNAGSVSYVEVILKEKQPTYFGGVIGFGTVPIAVRAEAERAKAPCIYALDKSGISAITVLGIAAIHATCTIIDESNSPLAFTCNVLANVTATRIRVTGGAENLLCNYNPAPETNVPVPSPADPLAYLPAPSYTPGVCTNSPTLGLTSIQILGTQTLNPGTYCGGIVIGPLANVTFNPGVYVLTGTGLLGIPLTGGMTVTAGATITGTGVTFYNAGPSNGVTGGITFAADTTSNINLTAPTSGTYAGILFYQNPANTAPAIFGVNIVANNTLQGALYFPSSLVTYAVSGGKSKFNILVAKDILFGVASLGSTAYEQSVFGNDYSSLPGGSPIPPTGAVLAQ